MRGPMTLRENREKEVEPQPLTADRMEEAITLANRIFPEDTDSPETANNMYRASLDPESYKDQLAEIGINKPDYWLATQGNKVVGLTGLYTKVDEPKERAWLGWYGTAPESRGQGLGRRLLEWTAAKAKELGHTSLSLYTTTDPNEAAAQGLYESLGYRVTRVEDMPGTTDKMLYREKRLDDEKISIGATLERLTSKSRFTRENRDSPNTSIEANGEKYRIETIDRMDHPDIPKVQGLFEKTFDKGEVDPEEVLRSAIEGKTPWGTPDITKYRIYAIKDSQDTVISVMAGGRLDLKDAQGISNGKQMLMIGYAVTDKDARQGGLATEAYVSAIMDAAREAQSEGKQLAFAAGECTYTSESFWNSLGWKRVYAAEPGKPGSYNELKYMQPALDFNTETGKVAEGAGEAPEHLMIDSFQGAPPGKEDVLATVRAFYTWCNTWPKEAFTSEEGVTNMGALREHQKHVIGIWEDFKKQITDRGPLTYLSREEREAAQKANVQIIEHLEADHGDASKEDF
ncbi:GNAT family N-acetyltransferase [Candidatus Kaiserbacteria bacterium]|nr:GNAT family N-acetyltransferase [Candidatus Kaiserbacteria bacterium]